MLQAPLIFTTAKLDISLLLKSSPPPSPAPSPPTTADRLAGGLSTRPSSVPPLSTSNLQPGLTPRTSTSSNVSHGASRADPSPNHSLPSISEQSQLSQPSQSPDHSRLHPAAPQLLHSSNPSTPLPPPLSIPRNLQPHGPAPLLSSSFHQASKRPPPSSPHPAASPAKRQSKWTPEEDALIIELRGSGMKWEDISKRLPGRSAISCRLHYQNYLERRSEWDEERKNRLARLYERLKSEMWAPVAQELGIPWRAAEAMHWQLGEAEMARRAGVVPFSLAANSSAAGLAMASLAPNQVGGSALCPAPFVSGAVGLPAPMGFIASTGAQQLSGESHGPRSARTGNFSLKHDIGVPIPPPISLIPRPNPAPAHSILPSMAELERGFTAPEEAGRLQERQQ